MPTFDKHRRLSARFDQAFAYASHLHASQTRKGSRTPYIAHLMGVAALVLEDGGSEDEAIAALLHDSVEDHPREGYTEEEIRLLFGERVLRIVLGCTDAFEHPKPPWKKRKLDYLKHLSAAPADIRRVSAADKLHNARAVLHDYRHQGERLWRQRRQEGPTLVLPEPGRGAQTGPPTPRSARARARAGGVRAGAGGRRPVGRRQ
jgi:(p)ppGpp synthase/HD superfamily hydrolase